MKSFGVRALGLAAISAVALHSMSASAHWIYATQASFQFGSGQAGIGADRGNDQNALGDDKSTFRSLGLGGSAVFGFGAAFTERARFWETTYGDCGGSGGSTCSNWPEQISVYAGNSWDFKNPNFAIDLDQWTALGTLGNADARRGANLAVPEVFRYLLVVDQGLQTRDPRDGFDIASVSAFSAVPIPAAGWLFGSALLGLAAVARRRKAAAAATV